MVEDALKLLESNNYDIVLMDIQMPGMDGIKITQEIRKRELITKQHITIIAMTAYALEGDMKRFISIGMDEYISKPFDMKSLFEIIDKVSYEDYYQSIPYSNFRIDDKGNYIITANPNEDIKDENSLIMEQLDLHIVKLNSLLEVNNLVQIDTEAHEIKLLSNKIGLETLKTIAFKIQLASRKCDIVQIQNLALNLNNEFQRLKKLMII